MKLDKNVAVYLGIGVFFLLVAINSTKKIGLNEANEVLVDTDKKNFDSSKLPFDLRPPRRWDDSEPLPTGKPQNLSLNGMIPRFDL
jgi:hypothetical protein